MSDAIQVQNLTYYGDLLAVDHIDFAVQQGQVFGFLGPNVVRWSLMFISGIFVPLEEMAPWARGLAYLSPLTCTQDLMNHAVLGKGFLTPWLDLALLPILLVVFLIPAARMHHRARVLGY